MAKRQSNSSINNVSSNKRKRPGVHSKCKTSNSKKSRYYKKKYKGQGR